MYNALQNLRKSKGLTKQQLAKQMKVSVDTISSLENGLLTKIASFFNVTIERLVTGCCPTRDQIELLNIYNSLNDFSKGMLFERALSIAEEYSNKNRIRRVEGNVIYADFNS